MNKHCLLSFFSLYLKWSNPWFVAAVLKICKLSHWDVIFQLTNIVFWNQYTTLPLKMISNYCKNPKISDMWKFAVITLKFEQDGFTKDLSVRKLRIITVFSSWHSWTCQRFWNFVLDLFSYENFQDNYGCCVLLLRQHAIANVICSH